MLVAKWFVALAKQLLMVLALWIFFTPYNLVYANSTSALYQAEVSAEQTQQQWQRDAFEQVLVRVTGQPDIMRQPQISSELTQVASYVKQFEALRTEQGNRVRVLLDAQRIQQLLRNLQIPVWGGQRPELLFWIVEQRGTERQFVRQADSIWLTSLQAALQAQALPFTLPLYDMDDVLSLTETDVWGGFWTQIDQSSLRYNTDQTVVLLLEETNTDSGTGWRVTALRQHNGHVLRDEIVATEPAELMQQFAARLSQQLAQQYAILLNNTAQQSVSIQINGANTLADVVTIERRLATMLGVSRVEIAQQSSAKIVFTLSLQMTPEQLLQGLQFEPNLTQRSTDSESALLGQMDKEQLDVVPSTPAILAEFDFTKS